MKQNHSTLMAVKVMAAIEHSILENDREALSFSMIGNWTLDVQFEMGTVFLSFSLPVSRTIPTYESVAGVGAISAQFFHFQRADFESQRLEFGNEIEHQISNFIASISATQPSLETESEKIQMEMAVPSEIRYSKAAYQVMASKRHSLSKLYNEGDMQLICCKARDGYTLYNIVVSADCQTVQKPIVMPESLFGTAHTLNKQDAVKSGYQWHLK